MCHLCSYPSDPPECKVRLLPKEKNGHTKIECQAIASPPVTSYTWTKDNVTVTTHELQEGKSGSILILYDGSIESYTCVTSNMMGVATCKLEAHQIQGTNYPLILAQLRYSFLCYFRFFCSIKNVTSFLACTHLLILIPIVSSDCASFYFIFYYYFYSSFLLHPFVTFISCIYLCLCVYVCVCCWLLQCVSLFTRYV